MAEKIKLNNVEFFAFASKSEVLNYLESIQHGILFAVNARKILTSPDYLKEIISANIGYIDGNGAVWAARRMGYKGKLVRIPGVELWLEIVRHFSSRKYYLLGAKEETIQATVVKLKQEFPKINIVGFRNGYLSDEDVPQLIKNIKSSGAEVVFVAMGSPRQEKLIVELIAQHKALYMGLGGSFDVYSGFVKRAPALFRKVGLEGPYRFLSNPRRLFDREIFYWDYFKRLFWGRF